MKYKLKKLETRKKAIDKEIESVEKAIDKDLDRTVPKYTA